MSIAVDNGTTTSSFDVMAIVQELIVCLNNADEPKLVGQIREQQAELRRVHEKQQQELKDIVAGEAIDHHRHFFKKLFFFLTALFLVRAAYSGKINKLKSTIEKEEARIVRTMQETKEIERKQDNVRDEISKLSEKGEGMHRQMSELTQELALAEKRVAAAKNAEEISVPKIKHALNLYANISNIRWDFNTTDRVKGYIAVPDDGSLRPFDLDKRQLKPYEVANFLWELSSADHQS